MHIFQYFHLFNDIYFAYVLFSVFESRTRSDFLVFLRPLLMMKPAVLMGLMFCLATV